ncbi:hypothetical protein NL676_032992 [Syzygium grande]|nr:hypothetical protein NL676_032992 [Syzygium grande]
MATQPSEEQGNLDHAEQPADVRVSVGSAPSQSGGAPEISVEQVGGRYYRPLLQATFKGDWESAKRFLEQDSSSNMATITSRSETMLHIAAFSAHDQFFENLVEILSPHPEALEMVDCDGRTALHIAVLCGRIRMVKALVRRNPKLTQLPDDEGRVPWAMSALEASMHKEIAWFLAKNTTDDEPSHPFSSSSAIDTIIDLTYAGHHGIRFEGNSILYALTMMPSHFLSRTRLSVLETLICKRIPVDLNYKPTDKNSDPALQRLTRSLWNAAKIVVPIIKRLHEVKLRHVVAVELAKQVCIAIASKDTTEINDFWQEGQVLVRATARGVSELVKLCIQFFPELIWIAPNGVSLVAHAVKYRRERTLGLFLKVSSTNEMSLVPAPTLEKTKRIMKEAAEYKPTLDEVINVSGAAFRMQRELQWFKAVESCTMPIMRTYYDEGTYWKIFVDKHKDLLESGEKWMKDTANSCMLISTLIATVLFAAAFTMPGGNDDKTGVPLLLGQDSILVFAISDGLGLFSSVTAILIFLAILTSRYEAQDFLESLPRKIIMGLSLLFLSLAFMLVAFAATLTTVLDKRLEWVLIPIALLASLPVALFVVLQLPLLYQMVKSTYGPSILRPESIWE